MDNVEKKIVDDIERFGWHVCFVSGEGVGPDWTFSIGVFKTFKHPDFVVFGLSMNVAHQFIAKVVENVSAGSVFRPGQVDLEILQGATCKFEIVSKRWYADLLGYGRWFYGGDDFSVFQIIWQPSDDTGAQLLPVQQPLLNRDQVSEAHLEKVLAWLSGHQHLDSPKTRGSFVPNIFLRQHTEQRRHKFRVDEWPFQVAENAQAYVTADIVGGHRPILGIVHDDDGSWQVLSGEIVEPSEVRAACLGCVYEFDKSIGELADLPSGWEAWREAPDLPWHRNYVQNPENR